MKIESWCRSNMEVAIEQAYNVAYRSVSWEKIYHQCKGGDRGALVSNLPIIANNQEIDDPTITYNMSIGLILGNNEVKTISFNGKLS